MNNKTSNVYPWVVVGLLWGVALLNYMDRQMLSTMRIPMMEDVRELESAANFGRLIREYDIQSGSLRYRVRHIKITGQSFCGYTD